MKIFKFHLVRTLKTPNFLFLFILVLSSFIYMFLGNQTKQATRICYENSSKKEFDFEKYNTENIIFEKLNDCENIIYISEINENEFQIVAKGIVEESYIIGIMQQINTYKNLKAEYMPLKLNYVEDDSNKNIESYNVLTFIVYFIILLVGSQIYQSVASERVNKINTMIDFKFSSIKLIWIKILSNVLSVVIILTIFGAGQEIMKNFGKTEIFEIPKITFEKTGLYFSYIVYMLLYLLTFSYVASFVNSDDQIQSYGFIPVFVTIVSYGLGFLFNSGNNFIVRNMLEFFPYTSLFVLPKIANEEHITLVVISSVIIAILFIILLSVGIKKNFRKES